MTIKELENRTGMARANIRFYEGEGLLAPRRLDNGYRDYSEEDVRTLEKIRLLRQLQLDIDTIRKVQRGTLTLEQALFTQLTRLEGDKALIEREAAVCRELERSGVEYAALEPRPWLAQLEVPAQPSLPQPPTKSPARQERRLEEGEELACYHPWMRLLARELDMALYDTILNAAWLLIFRDQSFLRLQTANPITIWISGLALLAFALAVEPLWLHYWGWTPGKWIFGLKLRNKDGEKLATAQYWERSWRVFQNGYGWDIPIYSLYIMWQCRKIGLEGRECWWDAEEDYRYTRVKRRFSSGWVFAAARGACVAALLAAELWNLLPLCRGALTVADFSRNYGHYQRILLEDYELPALDEQGRWKEPEDVVIVDVMGGSTVYDQPEFTLENDRVTAVSLHMRSEDYTVSGGLRESLALLAMTGSLDGLNLFNYDLKDWAETADNTLGRWWDVELDYRGLHISQQVKFEGYEHISDMTGLWRVDEGIPCDCEKTVTISLIE